MLAAVFAGLVTPLSQRRDGQSDVYPRDEFRVLRERQERPGRHALLWPHRSPLAGTTTARAVPAMRLFGTANLCNCWNAATGRSRCARWPACPHRQLRSHRDGSSPSRRIRGVVHRGSRYAADIPTCIYAIVAGENIEPQRLWGDPVENAALWNADTPCKPGGKSERHIAGHLRAQCTGSWVGWQLYRAGPVAAGISYIDAVRSHGIAVQVDLYAGGTDDWPSWNIELARSWACWPTRSALLPDLRYSIRGADDL